MTTINKDILSKNLATLINDKEKIVKLKGEGVDVSYIDEAIKFLQEKINERQGR